MSLKKLSDKELIESFNKEVGNPGTGFFKMKRLSEIREEFINRGFNYSEISDGKGSISYAKKVVLKGRKILIRKVKVELNIDGLLKEKKMKLSDLEKLVDLSYQQLWNIKEGRTTKVSFDTIGQLLEALKCKPNNLFKITE